MESGLPFQSISLAVEKARLEGQNKAARRPKRSPRPPDGSCLSQNTASGCKDAGEKGEKAQEDTSAGLRGRWRV